VRPPIRLLASCAVVLLAGGAAAHAQSVLWSRAYNGPSGAAAYLGNGYVIARSLAADAAGNVYATGSTKSGDYRDFLTTKIAADGTVAWQQAFAGPAGRDDDAMSIAVDSRGDVAIAGTSYDAAGNTTMRAIKYSGANGAVAWRAALAGGSYNAGFFVATDAAGNVLVAGETDAGGTTDIRVVKLAAASGAVLWDRTYDAGQDDFVGDLAVDAAGNAVVAGTSVNATGGEDVVVFKLAASNGARLWARTFDGGGDDQALGLALDGSGDAVAVGATKGATFDFLALKLAASDGAIVWRQAYDGGGDDVAQAVAIDHAGNAVVTGYGANAAGNRDFVTIKYAAGDGRVLWRKTFDGGEDDWAYAVALDGADNAYVAGTRVAGGDRNWMVIAYSAADGGELFSAPYASAGGGEDDATQVAASVGAIVVGGPVNASGSATAVRIEALAAGAGTMGANVALASTGASIAASSSGGANFPVASLIDGDRKGAAWGRGGGWKDATFDAWPDWVQVQFAGTKTIDHVVVYSLQDNVFDPREPTDAMTFASFGAVDFTVQAWNGSAWTTVGTAAGNDRVKRTVAFAPVATDRIRVNITRALGGYTRLVEVEAWTPGAAAETDYALASKGASASASSTGGSSFPPASLIDGDRAGRAWGAGGGWKDATFDAWPDWVQVQLAAPKAIDRVVVYSLQDDPFRPVEPDDGLTFSMFGAVDFTVQGWNGSAWVTLGTVTGNDRVKRAVAFAPFTTDRIRVSITRGASGYSRVVEVEAWGS
jgi:hypothetical protein